MHSVIAMLVTLAILIAFHEFGHFWVARKCGVKILQFSIGFGPKVFSRFDRQGTEFRLALLPLGGFVKMLDEREGEVDSSEQHQAFNQKPLWARSAIVAAGPIANFLLAIVVYWLIFLGGSTALKPQVYSIEENSVAAKAGMVVGETITEVDGKATQTAQEVMVSLLDRLGETGSIDIATNQGRYQLKINSWQSEQTEEVNLLDTLGFGFYQPQALLTINKVMGGSPAEKAGIKPGDVLHQFQGEALTSWQAWVEAIKQHPEKPMAITVKRNGQTLAITLTPKALEQGGKTIGQAGVVPKVKPLPKGLLIEQNFSVFTAVPEAFARTYQAIAFTFASVKKLLVGDLSYKQLSGPISIAKVAGESAQSGIYSYLSLLALLSVSLGVLNLLPIPVLDGGHLFFYAIEALKGSPVSDKMQGLAMQLGLFIVLTIMVVAVINDIGRL